MIWVWTRPVPPAHDRLLQMVVNLQDAGHGDAGRLAHIAETIARGRLVYDSDRRYVERKHAELGKDKVHDGVARNVPGPSMRGRTFTNDYQRAAGRAGYDIEPAYDTDSSPESEMRKTARPIDYPLQPPSTHRGYVDAQYVDDAANRASPEPDPRPASINQQPNNVDRSYSSSNSTKRRSSMRFKAGITLLILGVLVLAFDAWIIIAWGSQALFVTGSDLVLLVSIGGIGLILFISGLVLALVSRR